MSDKNPSLRFDHKEIFVIFSLFVFVSLLMFTVGILVGKGLSNTGTQNNVVHQKKISEMVLDDEADESTKATLSDSALPRHDSSEQNSQEKNLPKEKTTNQHHSALKFIPRKQPKDDLYTGSLREPSSVSHPKALDHFLKTPKLKELVAEADDETKSEDGKRVLQHPSKELLTSYEKELPIGDKIGSFRVQVASYLNEKDAKGRGCIAR